MKDETRQKLIDHFTAQIEEIEKALYTIQQEIEQGTATTERRTWFKHLHSQRDLIIRLRRNLELRHYDYVPTKPETKPKPLT